MNELARSLETRKQDTLSRLIEEVDAWVSTAALDGTPYLMPLSFLWTDETLVLSTARTNPTSRNLLANPQVHLAVGETRDVILITGTVTVIDSADLPAATADAFAAKAGFDPREASSPYPYFRVHPVQIQAWREVNEIADRAIMQTGTWLI